MMIDVILVGGGISGLTAASVLSKSDHIRSVLIVEARDRLGGRTKTVNASSEVGPCSAGQHTHITVDVGGQWIGPGQDRALALVKRFGLILEDQEFTVVPDSPTGKKYCSLIECAYYPLFSNYVGESVDGFIAMLRQAAVEIDLSCPWTHPKAKEWHALSVQDYVISYTTHPDAQAELLLFTQTVLACSPEHISFFFFVFYVASSGGMDALGDGEQGAQKWKVKGGTQQLSELMAMEMTSSSTLSPPSSSSSSSSSTASNVRILLSHRVTSIEQTDLITGGECVVTCAVDGTTVLTKFFTKRVIFAASPALIRKLAIDFQPPLPAEKVCLYDSMIMGACVKIVVLYRASFWTSHRMDQHATVSQAWQKRFGYIHNIFLGKVCCYPSLVCLSTGNSALALSNLAAPERKQAVLAQLVRMYGPEAANCVAYYEEDWTSSAFSGGCFAGLFPAGSPLLDTWSALRKPHGAVHFASTETSLHYYGYMEGAILSGERAAGEVLGALVSSTSTHPSGPPIHPKDEKLGNHQTSLTSTKISSLLKCLVLITCILSGTCHVLPSSSTNKPLVRPRNPEFSSGPCKKRPGYSLANLSIESLGRSHRSHLGKSRLKKSLDDTRRILGIPDDYLVGMVPGSDTGAFEMAMWNLLGERPIDACYWESFGKGWMEDTVKHLGLKNTRDFTADYGMLPALTKTNPDHDILFCFNGTTSGVCVPNLDWISDNRQGLTFNDATSAVFAMDMDWSKVDVTTYSWQKVLGGEGAHGMLIMSPRAVERLERFKHDRPLPKIFRMLKKDAEGVMRVDKSIFQGDTINTPSMLCVEDYLDALQWADSIGGLQGLMKRTQSNLAVLETFVAENDWIQFLAKDPTIRSSTSVCLTLSLNADQVKKFIALLETEKVAFDIGAYRDAPDGLRIWCGATVEKGDIEALLPWLKWAYETVRTG